MSIREHAVIVARISEAKLACLCLEDEKIVYVTTGEYQ